MPTHRLSQKVISDICGDLKGDFNSVPSVALLSLISWQFDYRFKLLLSSGGRAHAI